MTPISCPSPRTTCAGSSSRSSATKAPPAEPTWLCLVLPDFPVAVAQRLVPALAGQPLVMGQGLVLAASAEARALGVRPGQELALARAAHPTLHCLPDWSPIIQAHAAAVWAVAGEFLPGQESHGDYLLAELPPCHYTHGSPVALAQALRRAVQERTGWPIRLGLAPNRLLARLAASRAGPSGGRYWRRLADAEPTLARLAPGDLPELAAHPDLLARLSQEFNVRHLSELRGWPLGVLRAVAGPLGEALHEWCRGRPAEIATASSRPPAVQRERLLEPPLAEASALRRQWLGLLTELTLALREQGWAASAWHLTVVHDDRQVAQQHCRLSGPSNDERQLWPALEALLPTLHRRRVAARRLGLRASAPRPWVATPELFDTARETRQRDLQGCVDQLRRQYGCQTLTAADTLAPR